MNTTKQAVKGYWVSATDLYDFLYTIHAQAKERHDKIQILNHPDKAKLAGVMITIASTLEYINANVRFGNLRFPRLK